MDIYAEVLRTPWFKGTINEHLPEPEEFSGRIPLNESLDDIHLESINADTLVIAFGGCGTQDGLAQFAFGTLLASTPHSKLLVRDNYQCWYLNGIRGMSTNVLTTATALRLLLVASGAKRIMTTGTSGGGFAAILFGCLLRVDKIVAINPQTLLKQHVECVAHGNLHLLRWTDPNETRFRNLLNVPSPDTDIQIIFGRDDPVDVFHSGRMRLWDNVTLIDQPGDHGTTAQIARDDGSLIEFF